MAAAAENARVTDAARSAVFTAQARGRPGPAPLHWRLTEVRVAIPSRAEWPQIQLVLADTLKDRPLIQHHCESQIIYRKLVPDDNRSRIATPVFARGRRHRSATGARPGHSAVARLRFCNHGQP